MDRDLVHQDPLADRGIHLAVELFGDGEGHHGGRLDGGDELAAPSLLEDPDPSVADLQGQSATGERADEHHLPRVLADVEVGNRFRDDFVSAGERGVMARS